MKKENLTIRQLEKKKRSAILLGIAGTIMLVIISIITAVTVKINNVDNSQYLGLVLLVINLLPIFISQILTEEYDEKIELKEKEIRAKVIKKTAKEGNLKESVIIKKENIINNILIAGIKKVKIQKNNQQFIVSIYLENGYRINSLKLSNEKFLDLINQKTEEKILELLISNITIDSEEEGSTKLKIMGKDFLYEETISNDDELLNIFEVKE